MTQTIDAHKAVIHTAAVEINTLTIAGKQVTLAVFRQLKQDRLIDLETMQFRGVPWGTVNYFWKGCDQGGASKFYEGDFYNGGKSHLHVVWQHGSELRRDCVYPPAIPVRRDDRWCDYNNLQNRCEG